MKYEELMLASDKSDSHSIRDKTSHHTEGVEIRTREILNDIPNDILPKVVHSIPDCLRKMVDATGAYFFNMKNYFHFFLT